MKKLFLIPLIFFIGCSSKDVFIPKQKVEKKLKSTKSIKYLRDYSQKNLTFEELELRYTKKSYLNDGVWGEYVYYDENGKKIGRFIKINNDLAKNGDRLLLINEKKVLKLPYLIATATKQGDLIAIVFENNAEGIYDIEKKSLIFYRQNDDVLISKYLKAAPIFYNSLVLFPLLNSNIAVYDLNSNKFIRNIDLADDNLINNIIFLKIVNNQLLMATPNKIVLFNPNFLIDYKADIKHIIDYKGYIYLFLVDGSIVKLDSNLKKIKQIKLPFADFFAPAVCKGNIYTITYNKYLVKISPDLNVTVYSGNNFDINSPLKIRGCKIYNSNKVYFIE